MPDSNVTWDRPPEEVFGELADEYATAIDNAVYTLALRLAPSIEKWLKDNAEWKDRTANARQTLYAEVEQLAHQTTIYMSHGVTYSWFLELANGGKYSVLGPALDYWAPQVWRAVQDLLR